MPNTTTQLHTLRKKIFFGIIGTGALFTICYLYFVGNIIFNIVERKTTEAAILDLTTEIGELEVTYLATVETINSSYARELGFVEPSAVHYVSPATTVVRNYTLTHNEL